LVSHIEEEHTLWVYENRVLRRICGLKGTRQQESGENYINKELHNLYSSPNNIRVIKSRRMRWEGHVAYTGDRRGAHRVMVGKPEGERPLERRRNRGKDNTNKYLHDVGKGT
jgi:hypothetical protein